MWFDDLTKTFFAFNKRSSLSSGTCYTICNWWSLISPNSFTQEVREQPCGLRWVRTRPAHYESKSSIRYAIATKAPSSEIHSDKINSDIIISDKNFRPTDRTVRTNSWFPNQSRTLETLSPISWSTSGWRLPKTSSSDSCSPGLWTQSLLLVSEWWTLADKVGKV